MIKVICDRCGKEILETRDYQMAYYSPQICKKCTKLRKEKLKEIGFKE
jgi:hypothetical protein